MSRSHILAVALVATTTLGGCTTLGGNVNGSFSCIAPDGICAPSSTIDDRALALISGEDGDRMITPAGPYPAQRTQALGFQTAAASPARTQERVLRIVFPAQIDAAGRLHEQTAVHAVVERRDWQQALADNVVATTPEEVAMATGGNSLLAAVERADLPVADMAGIDPDMPSEAAVAAARANAASADPIGDIKDQVARRLSTQPGRQAGSSPAPQELADPSARPIASLSADTTPEANPNVTAAATQPITPSASPASPAVQSALAASSGVTAVVPRFATPAGQAALASVASNPAVRDRVASAEPEAREAARSANPVSVVRATSFPGVDQ